VLDNAVRAGLRNMKRRDQACGATRSAFERLPSTCASPASILPRPHPFPPIWKATRSSADIIAADDPSGLEDGFQLQDVRFVNPVPPQNDLLIERSCRQRES
jgi:hypothetical protein